MSTQTQLIYDVLRRLQAKLGTGESPAGSNHNFITVWYNDNVDRIGNGAWCEMTNTWAMWTGGAKKLKKGRAYTVYSAQDAQKGINGSSWHWGTKGMKAGDEVYYDWAGAKGDEGAVDHTGTVEKIHGDGTFYVLEGNKGDKLVRVHRDSKYVVGYIRFAWSHISSTPPPSPTPHPSPAPHPTPTPTTTHLEVDGELGPKTITRWQQIMKTTVDGKISFPSELVAAVQRHLKATVDHRLLVDGWGIEQDGHSYKTVGALQRYLGSPVDQVISKPTSNVIKALQRRLNSGRF